MSSEQMYGNPYEGPNAPPATETANTAAPSPEARRHLEKAAVVTATMLLAGSWAGVRYLPSSYFLTFFAATLGIMAASIVYSVIAKRPSVLLALPLFVVAVFGQELFVALFFLMGFLAFPIAFLFSLLRRTRENWLTTRAARRS